MITIPYTTEEELAELRIRHSDFPTLSNGVELLVFDDIKEYDNYINSFPVTEVEPVKAEIEWALDEPLKGKVTVKFVGYESATTVPYPIGFQWDDEWLINSAAKTL